MIQSSKNEIEVKNWRNKNNDEKLVTKMVERKLKENNG